MTRFFLRDERGHTAIEYALIAAVGALAIITSIATMGETVADMFTQLQSAWAQDQA